MKNTYKRQYMLENTGSNYYYMDAQSEHDKLFSFKVDDTMSGRIDGDKAVCELTLETNLRPLKHIHRKLLLLQVIAIDDCEGIPPDPYGWDISMACTECPWKIRIHGNDDMSYTKCVESKEEANRHMNVLKANKVIEMSEYVEAFGFVFTG